MNIKQNSNGSTTINFKADWCENKDIFITIDKSDTKTDLFSSLEKVGFKITEGKKYYTHKMIAELVGYASKSVMEIEHLSRLFNKADDDRTKLKEIANTSIKNRLTAIKINSNLYEDKIKEAKLENQINIEKLKVENQINIEKLKVENQINIEKLKIEIENEKNKNKMIVAEYRNYRRKHKDFNGLLTNVNDKPPPYKEIFNALEYMYPELNSY